MDREAVLAQCPLLVAVAKARRADLAKSARVVRLRRGEVVFRQGDVCPGMYVVAAGLVRVFKIAPSGKEHTLHIAGPGQTFAEVAVMGGFDCPAWAEAVEDATVLLLPGDPLRRSLRENHDLCLELLSGMAGWVRHLTDLLEDIVLRDAAARVARHLLTAKREPDGTCLLVGLRKHVANQLNLTAETLSRILHRMAEAGTVEVLDDHRLRLLNLEALRTLAGTE